MLLQKGFFDYNKLYYYSKAYESQLEMKNILKNLHKEDIVELFKQGIDEDEFHQYIDDL